MRTFQLTANRWMKVAEHNGLRGRWVEVKVSTSQTCHWDKKPGTSGTFSRKKGSMLQYQSLHVKSPVACTCTREWID